MPVKFAQNFFLGRRENGVKPAENRHWQHDALVLGRTIWAAQQISDLPDEIGKLVMIGHKAKLLKWEGVSNLAPGWSVSAVPASPMRPDMGTGAARKSQAMR